jgi:hypothetical protein
MRWVDVKSYVGLDRRGKRGRRLFDRRGESADSTPPSLATALRQLRLRCFDIQDAEGVTAFRERAAAIAQLAEAVGETSAAVAIMRLSDRLEGWSEGAALEPVVSDLETELQLIEAAVESAA